MKAMMAGMWAENMNQVSFWAMHMSVTDMEPANATMVITDRPSDSSYDTICAPERRAPMRVNLLLDDHPASSMPSTPIDETASRKNMPMLKSMICMPLPQGSTAKHSIEAMMTW